MSDATDTAAASASTPFPQRLIPRLIEQPPAPMLSTTDAAMPQCTAGISSDALALAEIGETDGDNQEGFEPFAEGDDKRLQHMIRFAERPA